MDGAVKALAAESLLSRGRFSPRLRKGKAAATQPASEKYVNQPVSPCSSGVHPVYEVVIADAVVEGNTELAARGALREQPVAQAVDDEQHDVSCLRRIEIFQWRVKRFTASGKRDGRHQIDQAAAVVVGAHPANFRG